MAILLNLIVAISSYLALSYFFYFQRLLDAIIAFFLLFIGQVIFSELLLGLLGILRPNFILGLNLSLLLASLFTIKYFKIKRKDSFYKRVKIYSGIFSLSKPELICFSLLSGFVIVKTVINLFNPPFGWDSLNYHFTFPVEWLKHGNLSIPIVVSDDPFPSYYPINGSLLFLWLILPFKSAFLADIAQFPFFILTFISVLSIARGMDLNKEYSFLAACLFALIPNFLKQLQVGYVDIMIGGMFLAALNFLLKSAKEFNFSNIFIFSLALGIFTGIKTTALTYGIFLFMPFLYLLFSSQGKPFRARLGYFILLLFMLFVFSSFSYLKGFILTGNPFYPINVSIMGIDIFKGVIDKATFTARNVSGDYSLAKLLFHEGMGVQSLLIILPGAILALPLAIIKDRPKGLFFSYLIVLPLVLYFVYRFILPIPNTRYLYPVLGLGMVVGFYVFSRLKLSLKIVSGLSVIAAIASAFECAKGFELLISFILAVLLFIVIFRYKNLRKILFSGPVLIAAVLISLLILQLAFNDYKRNEYVRYVENSRYWPDATRAWAWLNDNTQGNNIAYVGRPVPYPLYGTGLKNNVYYVSVNSIDPIKLHYLKNSKYHWDSDAENMHKSFEQPDNYRGHADYPIWLNNLKTRKTDFLFIYSLHHTKDIRFPIEEFWASSHPDRFTAVFTNPTIRVYKIIK